MTEWLSIPHIFVKLMLKKNILLFIQSSFYLHYQKAKFVKLFFIHLSMTMINHNDYFYHKEPKFF